MRSIWRLPTTLDCWKKEKHVNLLLIENNYVNEDEDGSTLDDDVVNIDFKFHYVWITNLSRLCSKQLSSRDHKPLICYRCLHYFRTEENLTKHVIDCEKINQCKITLPNKKNNTLEFTNFNFKNRVLFVIYSDFVCILKPVIGNEWAYQHHVPFSVDFFIKCIICIKVTDKRTNKPNLQPSGLYRVFTLWLRNWMIRIKIQSRWII